MVKKFVFVISLCMVLACCGCGDESDLRKVDADRAETYEETAYGDTQEHMKKRNIKTV